MKTKICCNCKIEKSIEEFNKNNISRDKHSYWCRKCSNLYNTIYHKKHKENLKKKCNEYGNKIRNSWIGIIPEQTKCQICGRTIYFNKKNSNDAIHFDHKNGKHSYIIRPTNWLARHKNNKANIKIWMDCDFGMLCGVCNRSLPTKNRKNFIKKVIKYIGDNL